MGSPEVPEVATRSSWASGTVSIPLLCSVTASRVRMGRRLSRSIGGIVVSIVVTIIWGVVAEGGSLRGENAADERDRAITQMGDRVGVAFLVIGGVVGIALCAIDAAPFWIANTLYAGFALSSVVGGIARVVAYRRGLV